MSIHCVRPVRISIAPVLVFGTGHPYAIPPVSSKRDFLVRDSCVASRHHLPWFGGFCANPQSAVSQILDPDTTARRRGNGAAPQPRPALGGQLPKYEENCQ